jgi:hypothetical protein
MSGLFGSTAAAGGGGGAGGVLWQAASSAVPPNRIASFLIERTPFFGCCAVQTGQAAGGSYG